MRVTVACERCRQRKSKCMHNGLSPCQSCKNKGRESSCELYTTQEFRNIRKSSIRVQIPKREDDDLSDGTIRSLIEYTSQQYPELIFLSSFRYQGPVDNLDDLLILGLRALSAPFFCTAENRKDISISLEIKLLKKIDDMHSFDLLNILQVSILMLILNWQNGKTHKGYLFGGFSERAYTMLSDQKTEHKTFLEKELFIRTLWSYQLITISLRKGTWKEYESRLCKFQLPQDNYNLLFNQVPEVLYLNNINIAATRNLFALFISATEIWADCSSWIIQGGRHHFLKTPWDETGEWYRLNRRLSHFESQLGPKESLSSQSLDAFFTLGQGSIYCYMHLTLLISKILIHRNYMPFIPLDDGGPKGPSDACPELKNSPPNWWENSAHIVFEAAKEASLIYDECKKRNMYFCSPFAGFVALTCASTLFYINSFPSYDPEFLCAGVYYEQCVEFLVFYKSHWELGTYYYEFQTQTVHMLKAAAQNKLTPLSISVFENMKNKLVNIANVDVPISKTDRIQIENLIESSDESRSTEELKPAVKNNEKNREKLCSLVGWENDWPNFDHTAEFLAEF